jgi:stage IV sporulation protein FB
MAAGDLLESAASVEFLHQRIAVVLFEPNETAYDLRWRMFGTPVRVHPMFWLIAVVLGYDATIREGIGFVLAWVACVFVSILLHEFGHVWMGRLFGSHGHIVLYSFGGLAIGSNHLSPRWQRILVLLAGPGIQLILWGLLVVTYQRIVSAAAPAQQESVEFILKMLLWINLAWPILNLLPVWPLDGGQVTREVCQAIAPEKGTAISLGISMVVSGVLAAHALMSSQGHPLLPKPIPEFGMFTAILFAMLCISSFSAMQAENERRRHWDRDEWT